MKHLPSGPGVALFVIGLIVFAMVSPVSLFAGPRAKPDQRVNSRHIASPEDVRTSVLAATAARQARIDKIAKTLDTEAVRGQLDRCGIGVDRVKTAVNRLGDAEISYLAARADGILAGVQGGHLSATFILILLGAFLLPLLIALVLS